VQWRAAGVPLIGSGQLPLPLAASAHARLGKTRQRRIEDIRVGDVVLAWDASSGSVVKRPVSRLFQRPGQPVLTVVLERGRIREAIAATTEHPFWVVNRGWVPTHDLRVGDTLSCLQSGPELRVLRIFRADNRRTVFNFEVSGAHTFYVGHFGVLVHNSSRKPQAFYRIPPETPPEEKRNWPASITRLYKDDDPLAGQHDAALLAINEYAPLAIETKGRLAIGGIIAESPDNSIYTTRPSIRRASWVVTGPGEILLDPKSSVPRDWVAPGHKVLGYWRTKDKDIPLPRFLAYAGSTFDRLTNGSLHFDALEAKVAAIRGLDAYLMVDGAVKYLRAGGRGNLLLSSAGSLVGGDVKKIGMVRTTTDGPEIYIGSDESFLGPPYRPARSSEYPGAREAFQAERKKRW